MNEETPEEKKIREQKTLENVKARKTELLKRIEEEKAKIPGLEKRKAS